MISSTLGAPLGGTTLAGHAGLESFAEVSITPANFCGSGGSCRPSMVVVALGEPGVPAVCGREDDEDRACAFAGGACPPDEDSQPGSVPSARARKNGSL